MLCGSVRRNRNWRRRPVATGAPGRAPRNIAFVCDGTLSSSAPGERTNAGRLARLLREFGASTGQIARYDRGVQGRGWERWLNAATGRTIGLSIRAGYGFLASRYRPGDRIFLFGYSRGGYAVRSLAGMIGRVGLLRAEAATERRITEAYRLYESDAAPERLARFRELYCHPHTPIEMLGVWDTVRALGLPFPGFSWFSPMAVDFHDHALGHHIRHGYHALAADETRLSYAPIKWERSEDWQGRLEQTWFPGDHADVGGEVRHRPEARGLSNIALNWMLRRAAAHGLALPEGWETRFPEDPGAPSSAGAGWLSRGFLIRAPRRTGGGDGESLHVSVQARMRLWTRGRYTPRACATRVPIARRALTRLAAALPRRPLGAAPPPSAGHSPAQLP